jgi:hypothetical protein
MSRVSKRIRERKNKNKDVRKKREDDVKYEWTSESSFMCISQTCFGSRGSMQTLRNVWAHLGVVKVMPFMNYELTIKHTYTFADLLQLPQHMACRNLIYRAFWKINLRKMHFGRVDSYWLSPRSRSSTELWQQRFVKQIDRWWKSGSATFKTCFSFLIVKEVGTNRTAVSDNCD